MQSALEISITSCRGWRKPCGDARPWPHELDRAGRYVSFHQLSSPLMHHFMIRRAGGAFAALDVMFSKNAAALRLGGSVGVDFVACLPSGMYAIGAHGSLWISLMNFGMSFCASGTAALDVEEIGTACWSA